MKLLTETNALERLSKLKNEYQANVRENYEVKAKDCLSCEVKGDCCTDAHFVNVHISKLEAVAITKALGDCGKHDEVIHRAKETIEKYGLSESENSFQKTFSCPLFEKETGCLVHKKGKPVPCVQHACYENKNDVPPDDLALEQEKKIERLNTQTYRNAWNWLPLPVWIKKLAAERRDNEQN